MKSISIFIALLFVSCASAPNFNLGNISYQPPQNLSSTTTAKEIDEIKASGLYEVSENQEFIFYRSEYGYIVVGTMDFTGFDIKDAAQKMANKKYGKYTTYFFPQKSNKKIANNPNAVSSEVYLDYNRDDGSSLHMKNFTVFYTSNNNKIIGAIVLMVCANDVKEIESSYKNIVSSLAIH